MNPFSFNPGAVANGFLVIEAGTGGRPDTALLDAITMLETNRTNFIVLNIFDPVFNAINNQWECSILLFDLSTSGTENAVQIYSEFQAKTS